VVAVVTTYITFGTDHDDAHPTLGAALSLGYVAVDLPGLPRGSERNLFYELFGARFAFDYDSQPGGRRPGSYPKGEIARIALINEQRRLAAVRAIDYTFETADGDSNDAEISALQEARDMLADLIGYTPKED
jgi:hypothetical protein